MYWLINSRVHVGMTQLVCTDGFRHNTVELLKTESLGAGSYGAVYKAKCGTLLCAAKILHSALFRSDDPEVVILVGRFERECHFLKEAKHPNIVQYLGTCQDPDTHLPVLLMELMDGNLTQFLEKSRTLLPYHTQVNFCHDVALALAYLHSNGVIHRDLSSNNVLLIAGTRAKVTDFGMSRLAGVNHGKTSMTKCPGTLVYMPPEALRDSTVYSELLDCFSFGVLGLQILTRQYPNPGVRSTAVDFPNAPTGTVEVPVAEVDRRRSDISRIDPTHPLLPVFLECLKDRDRERPTSRQLCHHLASLKEAPLYAESVQQAQDRSAQAQDVAARINEVQAEYRVKIDYLQQQHAEDIRKNQQQRQQLETNELQLADLKHNLEQSEATIQDLLALNDRLVRESQRRQQRRNKPNSIAEPPISSSSHTDGTLDSFSHGNCTLGISSHTNGTLNTSSHTNGTLDLKWGVHGSAPCEMAGRSTAVDGKIAYFNPFFTNQVYAYDTERQMWSTLLPCPHDYFCLAVVNSFLTAIGGRHKRKATNSLVSSVGEMGWEESFQPMQTKRWLAAAVCYRESLVVAGGEGEDGRKLNVVEVMNVRTSQWCTASSLPFPVMLASMTVAEGHVYIMGYESNHPKSVLRCSLVDLLRSCDSSQLLLARMINTVWHQIASLPFRFSIAASLCGQLLAIGGQSDSNASTSAIHKYDSLSNSWEVISHMPTARSHSLATVLPSNKLMVVGGHIAERTSTVENTKNTNAVEIATVH